MGEGGGGERLSVQEEGRGGGSELGSDLDRIQIHEKFYGFVSGSGEMMRTLFQGNLVQV